MKPYRIIHGPPSAEHLTAYVDGELDDRERSEVDAWLAEHPDAVAEVEAQRRLTGLWRATRPDELPVGAWDEALEQIETRLKTGAGSRRAAATTTRALWVGWLARLTGAAAAIWLLGVLDPLDEREPAREALVEPFPVASTEDVDIISMNANDTAVLVVGEPPLRDSLDLATSGEVIIHSVQPDVDGMVPQVLGQDETASVPMIVAPLVVAQSNARTRP